MTTHEENLYAEKMHVLALEAEVQIAERNRINALAAQQHQRHVESMRPSTRQHCFIEIGSDGNFMATSNRTEAFVGVGSSPELALLDFDKIWLGTK